jgi:hypothetical protein
LQIKGKIEIQTWVITYLTLTVMMPRQSQDLIKKAKKKGKTRNAKRKSVADDHIPVHLAVRALRLQVTNERRNIVIDLRLQNLLFQKEAPSVQMT